MAVLIGSARIDERGKITGGAAGDQTGTEVSFQNWYKHSKGWVVIRAKDDAVREKIAVAMEAACKNDNIGYDQSNRNGLYNDVKYLGFDPSKCTVLTETDCSALSRVCVHYAGITCPDYNTSSEVNVLKATGKFDILTDPMYTNSSDYLLRGDILVTKTKGHTVVVLTNGSKVIKPAVEGVALPVIKSGTRGEQAKLLQQNLNQVINAKLATDGSFGPKSVEALKNFQKKYGLAVDGSYGNASYNKMCEIYKNGDFPEVTEKVEVAKPTIKSGTRGEQAKLLQQNLNQVMGSGLKLDGSFGPKSVEALKNFQKKYSLSVDGIYGNASYNKMNSLLNA